MSFLDRTKRIPKFTGTIYYVEPDGDDSNDGLSPEADLQTIGAAIAKLSSGDAIVVGAGNYTENNLNLNVNACEMWFEIGAQISPTSGTALTISGNFCRVTCREGALKVNPANGEAGVVVTGNFCYLDEIRVACNSVGTFGYDFQGDGADARRCRCASPTSAAFRIQGDTCKLEDCCTGGEVANNSIGFWITTSADKPRLKYCGSQGHAAGGFIVDAGVTNGALNWIYTGEGDGKWRDDTRACVWGELDYDDEHFTTITLDGSTTYNLFKFTGAVRLSDIYGNVISAIDNTSSSIHLELYSTSGTADITDAPGLQIQADPSGTLYMRNEPSDQALNKAETDSGPAFTEADPGSFFNPSDKTSVDCVADTNADTYVRLVLSDAVTGGQMRWHCHWMPLSNDGFLEDV